MSVWSGNLLPHLSHCGVYLLLIFKWDAKLLVHINGNKACVSEKKELKYMKKIKTKYISCQLVLFFFTKLLNNLFCFFIFFKYKIWFQKQVYNTFSFVTNSDYATVIQKNSLHSLISSVSINFI